MLALPSAPTLHQPIPSLTVTAKTEGSGGFAIAAGDTAYVTVNMREKLDYTPMPESVIGHVLSADFIAPHGFRDAEMALDAGLEGVFVVYGRPGSGRETVATRLLLAGRPGRIEVLLPDWDVNITPGDLRCELEARYLLDLTNAELLAVQAWALTLSRHSKSLAHAGAQLIVTMTDHQYRACESLLKRSLRIDPPRASLLLRKQLAAHHHTHGGVNRLAWLTEDPLAQLVDSIDESQTPPSAVVNLAGAIIGAERSNLKLIVEHFRRWSPYLNEQLRTQESGSARRRALLISAAAWDTFDVVQVLAAEQLLLDALHITVPPTDALESEGLSARLARIHAEIVNDCVHLGSSRPGVCSAILDFVWNDHPDLRKVLIAWLKAILGKRPSAKTRDRVAEIIIDLAVSNTSKQLVGEMYQWLRNEGEAQHVALSCLDALLVNPTLGSLTQAQLYRAATSNSTECLPQLAQLCSGALAERSLSRALIRLRPIAAKAQTAEHRDAVRTAIRRIADEPAVRVSLLNQATEWSLDRRNREVGRTFLLALIDPDGEAEVISRLLAEAALDDRVLFALQTAWLQLLEDPNDPAVGAVIASWCSRVDQGRFHGPTVQEIFGPVTHHTMSTPACRIFISQMSPAVQAVTLQWLAQ